MSEKPTILVVDDEPSNLDVLAGLFRTECSVLVAKSGDQALSRMRGATPVDLILLDVMMPGMDGYEVCRRLKEDEATRDIPVMFVTAMSEIEDETKGLALGAVDYIVKPISPPIVLARVRGVLARQRLQRQLDEMQLRLSAMIVHDLRNPLSVILGFADVLLMDDSIQANAHLTSSLGRIASNAKMALSLVTQMLDLSQLRAGKVTLARSPIDVGALLVRIVQEQTLLARTKRIALEADIERGLVVDADEIKLTEAVVNLLANAVKFTPSQGRIDVTVKRGSEGRVVISVADSGPGVPAGSRTSIFAPWETAGSAKGYGLGLAICRMIMLAHGGTISVDDSPSGGARFDLSLPLVRSDA